MARLFGTDGIRGVAGRDLTAEFAFHLRDQEGHIEDVDLVREDVIGELALEHHDGVEGDGTADESAHESVASVVGRSRTVRRIRACAVYR